MATQTKNKRSKFNYNKLVKRYSTADANNEQPMYHKPATLIDIEFHDVDNRRRKESRWIAFTYPNADGKGDVIFSTTIGGYNWYGARVIREAITAVKSRCQVSYEEAERMVWNILEEYKPAYGVSVSK